ncbi:hypothetical protein ACTMTF_07175, partial [Nonomuraea sp. ZG12]|uniref:hypothetical protein n=1 Tax=Nonomuraea sp. ZG12 TaxID=3452207 RepID=UPI003F8A8C12
VLGRMADGVQEIVFAAYCLCRNPHGSKNSGSSLTLLAGPRHPITAQAPDTLRLRRLLHATHPTA